MPNHMTKLPPFRRSCQIYLGGECWQQTNGVCKPGILCRLKKLRHKKPASNAGFFYPFRTFSISLFNFFFLVAQIDPAFLDGIKENRCCDEQGRIGSHKIPTIMANKSPRMDSAPIKNMHSNTISVVIEVFNVLLNVLFNAALMILCIFQELCSLKYSRIGQNDYRIVQRISNHRQDGRNEGLVNFHVERHKTIGKGETRAQSNHVMEYSNHRTWTKLPPSKT